MSPIGNKVFDWTKSSPIKVIRGFDMANFSSRFAPTAGYHYDGLYKVVKYWT